MSTDLSGSIASDTTPRIISLRGAKRRRSPKQNLPQRTKSQCLPSKMGGVLCIHKLIKPHSTAPQELIVSMHIRLACPLEGYIKGAQPCQAQPHRAMFAELRETIVTGRRQIPKTPYNIWGSYPPSCMFRPLAWAVDSCSGMQKPSGHPAA